MKIAVLGAGIVGLTTALELAKQVHQVCVYEQHSTAAEEASFAIPGLLGPAYVGHWAFNSSAARFGRDIWSPTSSVLLGRGLQGREWLWLWQWLRSGKNPEDSSNRLALMDLARLSQHLLDDLAHGLNVEYEQHTGLSVLLRTPLEAASQDITQEALKNQGIAHHLLDEAAVRQLEPALNPDTPLHAALHLPNERTANCRQVALLVKRACDELGVEFCFEHEVRPLRSGQGTVLQFQNGEQPVQNRAFDAVVVCAGQESTRLLQQICPKLPCAAVHGYSISSSIREPLNAPRHSWYDWQYRVTLSRLGQRVRVSGVAELGVPTPSKRLTALKTLYKVLLDWFPGAAHMQQVQEWRGTRTCTPDGLPLIGPTPEKGIWLNFAHADTGWALAFGAAQGVAGLIRSQPVSGIPWQRFFLSRFN